MNKLLALFSLLCLLQYNANGQGWIKTYYDYSSNYLETFGERTPDNGFVMTGHTGTFTKDVHVKKVDQFGNIQWTKTLTKGSDRRSIAVNYLPIDSGYVVLYRDNFFNGHLLRLDANGQTVYDLPINIGMNIWTGVTNTNMKVTNDNHLVITSVEADTSTDYNMGLAKLDLTGNVLWTQAYNLATYQSYSMDIIETTDGNYLLAGQQDTLFTNGGG